MAKSKYFQKKIDDVTETLPVDEALEVLTSNEVEKTEEPIKQVAATPKKEPATKKAYDVFFDRSTMSFKVVCVEYDLSTHKCDVKDVGKNQALAATMIQKTFAMKFLKRKG